VRLTIDERKVEAMTASAPERACTGAVRAGWWSACRSQSGSYSFRTGTGGQDSMQKGTWTRLLQSDALRLVLRARHSRRPLAGQSRSRSGRTANWPQIRPFPMISNQFQSLLKKFTKRKVRAAERNQAEGWKSGATRSTERQSKRVNVKPNGHRGTR